MASNPIYDPPSNHWIEIPRWGELYGFTKITNNAFLELKNPQSPYAKPYQDLLLRLGIWNSISPNVVYIFQNGVNYINFSSFVYYKQSGPDFIPNTLTQQQLVGLIEYVENNTIEQREQDTTTEPLIRDINNSKYGCVEGVATGVDRSQQIKFFFRKNGSNISPQNNNGVGLRGDIHFVGVPKTSAGTPYSASQTAATDQIGTYESGQISNDPKNVVAGQLDLNYNHNTNKWELASTFLAKLLTDVEAVPIREVNLDIQNTQGRTSADFYGRNAPERMSDFKTGMAAPLSMQNNNPFCYGPNIVKCKTNSKIESIRVVNRSNISFKRGEIVTVFKIDGENIIGKYTSDTFVQLPPQPGRWVFSQFIASSDEYFRYADGGPSDGYLQGRPNISPVETIDLLRRKYYQVFTDDVGRINFSDEWPTGTLFLYFPWEVFDLFDEIPQPQNGDGNDEPPDPNEPPPTTPPPTPVRYFNRINTSVGLLNSDGTRQEAGGLDNVLQKEIPLFWGPVFPNGLQSRVNRTTSSIPRWNVSLPDPYHTPAFVAMPNALTDYYYNIISYINSNITSLIFQDWSHLNTTRNDGWYPIYGKDFVQATDPLSVQFNFLSSELVGAGDLLASANYWPQDFRIWSGSTLATKVRAFYDRAGEIAKSIVPQYPDAGGYRLVAKTLNRRNFSVTSSSFFNYINRPSSFLASLIDGGLINGKEPPAFPTLPYDLYVDFDPLERPRGAPAFYGGDTAPREEFVGKFRGANCVGITSAKMRMNQGSGGAWTANFSVQQTFGMRGRWFGGGGGGNIAVTIIGAFLAFSTDNRGRFIDGMVPMWGSYYDRISSFGTGAVHVQAWDAWPDEQTVWVPQYFTALHFNPTYPRSNAPYDANVEKPEKFLVTNYYGATKIPNSDTWQVPPSSNFPLHVFPIGTTVDHRIPTYGHIQEVTNANGTKSRFPAYSTTDVSGVITSYAGSDGLPVAPGSIVGSGTILRQESLWNLDRSRRGKLVTKYGYIHTRTVIGVDPSTLTMIDDPNSPNSTYPWADNFTVNDEFVLGNGVVVVYNGPSSFSVKILTVDDIMKELETTSGDFRYKSNLPGNRQMVFAAGSGFLPSDFAPNGKQFVIKPKNGGPNRFISFSQGKAYDAWFIDKGPRPRSNIVRITDSAGEGTARVTGVKSTTLQISGNEESPYRGQYELHFHVHNDIGFVLNEPPESTVGLAMGNWVTLTIK